MLTGILSNCRSGTQLASKDLGLSPERIIKGLMLLLLPMILLRGKVFKIFKNFGCLKYYMNVILL